MRSERATPGIFLFLSVPCGGQFHSRRESSRRTTHALRVSVDCLTEYNSFFPWMETYRAATRLPGASSSTCEGTSATGIGFDRPSRGAAGTGAISVTGEMLFEFSDFFP